MKFSIVHLVFDLCESMDGHVDTLVPVQRTRIGDYEFSISSGAKARAKQPPRRIVANRRTFLGPPTSLSYALAPKVVCHDGMARKCDGNAFDPYQATKQERMVFDVKFACI